MIEVKMSKNLMWNELYQYLIIISLILGSGAVIGTMNLGKVYVIEVILLVIGLFYKGQKIRINYRQLFRLLFFLCYFAFNFTFISDINGHLESEFKSWFMFVVIWGLSLLIDRDGFIKKYIYIMVFLSITGMLFYFLAQIDIHFLDYYKEFNGQVYHMSPLYVYGFKSADVGFITNSTTHRNFGIFWEPGGYQAYLSLAIILLLFNQNKFRKFKLIFIVLFMSLLSTQSTTGYLTAIILTFVFWIYSNSNQNQRRERREYRILKKTIFLVIVIVIGIIILRSETVVDKLSDPSGGSIVERTNDNAVSLSLVLKRPIFGYGRFNAQLHEMLIRLGVKANSSGLFIVMLWYGLFFGGYWFLCICENIRKMSETENNKILNRITVYVVVLFMVLTEHILAKQLFLFLLFNLNLDYKER